VRALEAMSIATEVHCSESANASGAHSARKGLGFESVWRVPAADRADRISPRFEIQVWGAEKIAARTHHRLYQVRSNSETTLKVRAQGKKFFFYTSVTETSSLQPFRIAGYIHDDTDLTGLWITIDHASETLQYGSEAMLYRFERTQLDVRFASVDYEYPRANFPKTPAALSMYSTNSARRFHCRCGQARGP
jgi:hypothetical protein